MNVTASTLASTEQAAIQPSQRVRISGRVFWMLCAAESMLLIIGIVLVLHWLSTPRVSLVRSTDAAAVQEAVRARFNGSVPDPLIEVEPGVVARASNVRGFTRHGFTYYYYFEGTRGFDPLSRGAVSADNVEIVLRDEGPGHVPLVIYHILNS